jgi:hypothetical protein
VAALAAEPSAWATFPKDPTEAGPMLLIREIFHCKPGKVRPMVEKFLAMSKLGQKSGMPKMKIMTDFCGDRYWTVVAEMEVGSMADFERMMKGEGQSKEDGEEMEKLMKGYHDLVEHGRREIYKIES